MIVYHETFKLLLEDAVGDIQVYYNDFDEATPVPVVSYIEINNSQRQKGDTLKFSTISYRVNVWSYSAKETNEIAQLIDDKLCDNGFIRTSSSELIDDEYIMKALTYTATGYEKKGV